MRTLHPDSSISQFIGDDQAYLNWIARHPEGFVVNSARTPSVSYLVLHRATCGTMSSPTRSNWTTTGFIKTCSLNADALSAWAADVVGEKPSCCGHCKPKERFEPEPELVLQQPQKQYIAPMLAPARAQASGKRAMIPDSIESGCPELDLVWRTFALDILNRPHVLIPDTEDDLNWHAFLGHSIDMQGFRAAEFAGVDPLSKSAPGFIPLRERKIGIPELGQLWDVEKIRNHLLGKNLGSLSTTLHLLRSEGGKTGQSLAEAFDTFPYRKAHWTVRALLQNSNTLQSHGYSFRNWLKVACQELGEPDFPPSDFRRRTPSGKTLEMTLRRKLQETFYMVGPALAPYMLCDWQLWLWNEGKIPVFANFKLDSFHEEFVNRFGRGLIPASESDFADWWLGQYPDLPPRLANECIWLGMDRKTV